MTMMQYTGMCLGEGMFEKNTQGDQGMLGYHPPPGCSSFRAVFPVRNFSEFYRALPGRKKEFLRQLLLWYFWYFQPSQDLLVAMLIKHHSPQPVILYNQVRVLLGCDNVHKAKIEKTRKEKGKKEREVVAMPRFELRT